MQPMMSRLLLLIVAVSFLSNSAQTDTPQLITYQGYLTDDAGEPLNLAISVTFTIYDSLAAGNALWTETHPTVGISDGLLGVLLGSVATIPANLFNGPNRWLGVTIGTDPEIAPRTQLVSVVYALRVGSIDGASGGIITDSLVVTGTIQSTSGGIKFPDGTTQTTAAGASNGLPLTGGTMTGPIQSAGDPPITMGKGNFGTGNTNTGVGAFVAGTNNTASGDYSGVGSGNNNVASGDYSFVAGGQNNIASGINSDTTGGGVMKAELANGAYAFVGGGESNEAAGRHAAGVGGLDNKADGEKSFVGGGRQNTAHGELSTISGGGYNHTAESYSTVGGGGENRAIGLESTVGGGAWNTAKGEGSTVAGGRHNKVIGEYSVIAGGGSPYGGVGADSNSITGDYSFIGGGQRNIIAGNWSVVGGGYGDTAIGNYSTIGGGYGNTASGANSVVPGGADNSAGGNYSFAGGRKAVVRETDHGTFVWADNSGGPFESKAQNQFLIRATGGVGIGTDNIGAGVALEVAGIIRSTAGGFRFPDNTVMVSAPPEGAWQQIGPTVSLQNNSYSVGIGTQAPTAKLGVDGAIHASGVIQSGGSITLDGTGGSDRITTNTGRINFVGNDLVTSGEFSAGGMIVSGAQIVAAGDISSGGSLKLTGGASSIISSSGKIHFVNADLVGTGKIGVGTSNPAYELDVVGTIHSDEAIFGPGQPYPNTTEGTVQITQNNFGYPAALWMKSENGPAEIRLDAHQSTSSISRIMFADNNVDLWSIGVPLAGLSRNFLIYDSYANAARLSVDATNGNVGIGTATPQAELDVIGDVQASGTGTFGSNHTVLGTGTFVAGYGHSVYGDTATVAGGADNQATKIGTTVGGGTRNEATGDWATIGGGTYNKAKGLYSTVPGGTMNDAFGDFSFAAGYGARALHERTFVWTSDTGFISSGIGQFLIRASGGVGINTSSPEAELDIYGQIRINDGTAQPGRVLLSSDANGLAEWVDLAAISSDDDWDIVNGVLYTHDNWGVARYGNVLNGTYASTHTCFGVGSTTGEAGQNHSGATVSGGNTNEALNNGATVSGGSENSATGSYSTVGGGSANMASGGGATVAGGSSNFASGVSATVPGGTGNRAQADYSLASGTYASVMPGHDGTFVWADHTTPFVGYESTGPDQFLIRATNGVGINTNAPTTDLDVDGQIRIRGGSPALGQVLTSDATGLATWQSPTPSGWIDNSSYVTLSNIFDSVGIGTNTPTEHLDVNGTIRIRQGNPASGRVLTSTANGSATWQEPDGGGWVHNGSYVNLSYIYDSVGIGTNTPTAHLDVDGIIRIRQGNPAVGRVLTSTANGTATWQDPASVNTLDGAYDAGGPGAGRVINADAGFIDIDGPGGLRVEGNVTIGEDATPSGSSLLWAARTYSTSGTRFGLYSRVTNDHPFGEAYGLRTQGTTDGPNRYGLYSYGAAITTSLTTGISYGVRGDAEYGAAAVGVYGLASNAVAGYGIYGSAAGNTTNWAGFFAGNVQVTGTLSKAAGSFKIDHPLDPENKYLSHSFVESPDMMNVYNGNITTDETGKAVVELPEYFESLNKDFRYQLTVIGQFAQAIISQEIDGREFVIMTDKPSVKVSWQVTGIRKDAYAEANRIQVETEKTESERGKYLHPKAHGLGDELGVNYDLFKQMEDQSR